MSIYGRSYITDKETHDNNRSIKSTAEIMAEDVFIFYVEMSGNITSEKVLLDALKTMHPHEVGIDLSNIYANDLGNGLIEVSCGIHPDIHFLCDYTYDRDSGVDIEDITPIKKDIERDMIDKVFCRTGKGLNDIRCNLIDHLNKYFKDWETEIYLCKEYPGLTISDRSYEKSSLEEEGFKAFKDYFLESKEDFSISYKEAKEYQVNIEKE